jgi:hypothetical protein
LLPPTSVVWLLVMASVALVLGLSGLEKRLGIVLLLAASAELSVMTATATACRCIKQMLVVRALVIRHLIYSATNSLFSEDKQP